MLKYILTFPLKFHKFLTLTEKFARSTNYATCSIFRRSTSLLTIIPFPRMTQCISNSWTNVRSTFVRIAGNGSRRFLSFQKNLNYFDRLTRPSRKLSIEPHPLCLFPSPLVLEPLPASRFF